MTATWGKRFKITIFGESHGEYVGITIDGIPSGIKLDYDFINFEMDRRASKGGALSTTRVEKDRPNIISGILNDITTGAPLTALIKNENKKSGDYDILKSIMRPGHADFTANIKYKGFNDYRGGGHFSGRLTAPIVFAGAIAKQILNKYDIYIGSHIKSIGHIEDTKFDNYNLEKNVLEALNKDKLPLLNKELKHKMRNYIQEIKSQGDSLGGVVECAILGIPVGIGSPFFESIESVLSSIIFSIPAVKGIEFGSGFDITKMVGSQANDEFYYDKDGSIKTRTNNNGGVNGGISNGMPILFSVAVKPTPSISKIQKTINIKTKKNQEISVVGRHDPIIVPRIIPVIEAVSAIATLDMIFQK